MKLFSSLNSSVSPHNNESPAFSSIGPGSGSSSDCAFDCLFQSSFDHPQFPVNYDTLTANFDCSERTEKCKDYTR